MWLIDFIEYIKNANWVSINSIPEALENLSEKDIEEGKALDIVIRGMNYENGLYKIN